MYNIKTAKTSSGDFLFSNTFFLLARCFNDDSIFLLSYNFVLRAWPMAQVSRSRPINLDPFYTHMGLQILEITEQKSTRKTKFLAELTASTNLFWNFARRACKCIPYKFLLSGKFEFAHLQSRLISEAEQSATINSKRLRSTPQTGSR